MNEFKHNLKKAMPWIFEPNPLSRRDEFAKAAMIGLLSRNNPVPDVKNDGDVPEFIAQASLALADAMIAALDGGGCE